MGPNKGEKTGAKKPLLTGILLVSVILNLFLVGIVAGVVPLGAKHKGFGPMVLATPHGAYMVEWMERYLPPADAALFQEAFQKQADALKQAHDQARDAVKDVASAFEQDPVDQEALQAAMDHLSKAKAEVNDAVALIVKDASSKLSPEGRRRLAELAR
jgi:uncharacterized membrane protein